MDDGRLKTQVGVANRSLASRLSLAHLEHLPGLLQTAVADLPEHVKILDGVAAGMTQYADKQIGASVCVEVGELGRTEFACYEGTVRWKGVSDTPELRLSAACCVLDQVETS